jgi:hypothetical protein
LRHERVDILRIVVVVVAILLFNVDSCRQQTPSTQARQRREPQRRARIGHAAHDASLP